MHGGGCFGISYGLQYPAGCYAGSSELAVLSSVAARFGGITSAHIRSEGNQLVESVTEMVQATAQSSCTLVISHHKAINRPNWGKTAATISLMQEVNQQGHSVYCDVYPYTASSTGLKSRIPQSMHVLGRRKASADAVGSIRPQEDARCDPGRNDAGRTIRNNHVRCICHSS